VDFIDRVDRSVLEGNPPIAESDQFAIYALGDEAYLLVQRHAAMPWTGLRVSGDGLFRVAALFADATRHLYRDVASQLSPVRHKNGIRRPGETA
jgi:hypothetical protein